METGDVVRSPECPRTPRDLDGRPEQPQTGDNARHNGVVVSRNWTCPDCEYLNDIDGTTCFNCELPRPTIPLGLARMLNEMDRLFRPMRQGNQQNLPGPWLPFDQNPRYPWRHQPQFEVDIDNMSYEERQAMFPGDEPERATEKDIRDNTNVEKFSACRCKKCMAEVADEKTNCTAEKCKICTICQCDFEDGDEIRRLPCGCIFHDDCNVDNWLKKNKTCPNCRIAIDAPQK